MSVIPDKEDDAMENMDTGIHAEKSLSRQIFNQKSPLGATDPNARLGTPWRVKDTVNGHIQKVESDDVDIRGLEIVDRQP